MRNVIAAIAALAAVAAAVWVGVDLLTPRVDRTNVEVGPDEVMADFATTWSAGDAQRLRELVHADNRNDLESFLAATDAMMADLDATIVTMEVGEVTEIGQRATSPIEVTVTLAPAAPAANATPGASTPVPGTTSPAPGTSTSGASTSEGPASESPGAAATDDADVADGEVADQPIVLSWSSQLSAEQRADGWTATPVRTTLHPDVADDTSFARSQADSGRASILDITGQPLTTHGDLVSIGIHPAVIRESSQLQTIWAQVLPNSLPQLQELLARDDLNPDWFHPVVSVSREEADRVWTRLRTVPGAQRRAADEGTPSGNTFGLHVLGRVGNPTAEQVAEWGVTEGEPTGILGLERVLDERLDGALTTTVSIVDDDGEEVTRIGTFQPDSIGPVATSLDIDVQRAIESALLGVTDNAAVVVVRTDGGIAGAASRPVEGYNRAFEGQYAPGDALVPVTASALVAAGAFPDVAVLCPATNVVAGAAMVAPSELGRVDMQTALAGGCDTSVASLVQEFDPDLVTTARAMGFDRDFSSLPLAAASGTFPEPIDLTEAVRDGAGQGRVLATPLLVATTVAETIADASFTPWLLAEQATTPTMLDLDTAPARAILEAGLDGTGAGLLPVTGPAGEAAPPRTPGSDTADGDDADGVRAPPDDAASGDAAPGDAATGTTPPGPSPTSSPDPTASAGSQPPATPLPSLVGALSGTGAATGSDELHAWAVAALGDLGIAVMVEDTDGDMALARAIMARIDRELTDLRTAG